MFRHLKNIDSAFRYIRGFTFLIVTGSFMVSGLALFESYRLVTKGSSRIYVLAGGKAFPASASDRAENVAVEARDHIRTFHHLFFTLDPDEEVIRDHISRALYLADASAKMQYEDLREKGYYAGLIAGNISERLKIDSIRVETALYPYYFRCYGTEEIIRTTRTVIRNLVTQGYLREVSRSDHNPHGFLIERWMILENRDIATRTSENK